MPDLSGRQIRHSSRQWAQALNDAHHDVPIVGMSCYDAEETKLGTPSQTEKYDTESGEADKMTWCWFKEGNVIFEAYYSNDTITAVEDKRSASVKRRYFGYNSGSGSSKNSGASSGSGSGRESWEDPVDPDDYNLDGFYEDYEDEFDDIDDAYDAFLDDEEWEND